MVKVHINNTKHITIANIYIPPRGGRSAHYRTSDMYIRHCMQYVTDMLHSVRAEDAVAHSTLWHSYTDDHRGQLVTDVISNSVHMALNADMPTRIPGTTLQKHLHQTTQHTLSSGPMPAIAAVDVRYDYSKVNKVLQTASGPPN